MDKLTMVLLVLAALIAVCTAYPTWGKSPRANYWMKQQQRQQQQQRMRQTPPSRRPATIRSRLTVPVKPSTSVRHHVSVKNVPVHDGHIGIIKQTLLVKTPKTNRPVPKSRPASTQPSSPTRPGIRPSYRPPTHNSTGQGRTPKGRRGHNRNTQGPNNNGHNLNDVSKLGRNTNGLDPQKQHGLKHEALLPAISTLNKHLGSLIDVLRAKNSNGALPVSTSDPLHFGTSIPTIVVVDHSGLHDQGHRVGSGRISAGQRGAMLDRPLHKSLFDSPRPHHSGGASFSSHRGSPKDIIVLPNGPNTHTIRISTKSSLSKTPGNLITDSSLVTKDGLRTRPVVSTTPSGEDPPEAGELGEP